MKILAQYGYGWGGGSDHSDAVLGITILILGTLFCVPGWIDEYKEYRQSKRDAKK
jgi:hypothetical protein